MPFIILPFLSRKFSQSAFGEFMVVMSIIAFVNVVLSGSISMFIYRRQGDLSVENKPIFLGSTIKLSLLIIVAVGMALLFLKPALFRRWELDFTLLWFLPLIAYMMLTSINGILYSILSLDLRFSFLAFCSGIYLILSAIVIVFYLLMPDGVWTIGFVFAPLSSTLMMLYTLIKRNKLDFRSKLNMFFIKEFITVNTMFFIIIMMANLMIYGDRWLLAEYNISKEDIAVYSVAASACMLFTTVMQQASKVLIPIISNIKNYEDITVLQSRKILAITLLSVPLVAVLGGIGGFLYIRVFFGEAYWLQSKSLFLIIFSGVTLYSLQIFSRAFLVRFRSLWLSLMIYCVACIIMLLTIGLLVEGLQVRGFAFARQFSYMWIAIASFVIAQGGLIKKIYNKGT